MLVQTMVGKVDVYTISNAHHTTATSSKRWEEARLRISSSF